MNYSYCVCCGGELAQRKVATENDRERLVCGKCGYIHYLNPVPATAVVIEKEKKILLVRRAGEPKKGLWSLPAGFIEISETVEECAVREVLEETGLEIELDGLEGIHTVFDDPRYVCLLIVYCGSIVSGELKPGDDAAEAGYFGRDDLPPIAFSVHEKVIMNVI